MGRPHLEEDFNRLLEGKPIREYAGRPERPETDDNEEFSECDIDKINLEMDGFKDVAKSL